MKLIKRLILSPIYNVSINSNKPRRGVLHTSSYSIILFIILFFSLNKEVSAKNVKELLSKTDIERLKSIQSEVSIILPNYIPNGFKVTKIEVNQKKNEGRFDDGASYTIVFSKALSNGKHSSFTLETTSGGVGDLMNLSEQTKIKTHFGDAYVYFEPISAGTNKKIDNCFDMEWIQIKSNFYRLYSGNCFDSINSKKNLKQKRISKEDALNILKSLYLVRL